MAPIKYIISVVHFYWGQGRWPLWDHQLIPQISGSQPAWKLSPAHPRQVRLTAPWEGHGEGAAAGLPPTPPPTPTPGALVFPRPPPPSAWPAPPPPMPGVPVSFCLNVTNAPVSTDIRLEKTNQNVESCVLSVFPYKSLQGLILIHKPVVWFNFRYFLCCVHVCRSRAFSRRNISLP